MVLGVFGVLAEVVDAGVEAAGAEVRGPEAAGPELVVAQPDRARSMAVRPASGAFGGKGPVPFRRVSMEVFG
ncbi:hypothetical protein [Nonomuraea sp. NPDC049709]|uniref:hypothetical protein n=1 Tax=Nonomuraea sp. NPDC049709 TaxID=3154736 RepID=UPI0034392CEC